MLAAAGMTFAALQDNYILLAILGVLAIVLIIFIVVVAGMLKLWVNALAARAYVRLFSLVGMKLRKVDPGLIVTNRVKAKRAGIDLDTDRMESFYLSRGNVELVTNAAVMAYKAGLDIDVGDLEALFLAGGDVNQVVGAMIIAHKGGLSTTFAELESHHLAGGSVQKVITALIAANRANINLDFNAASAIDLAAKNTGREVDVAVREYVTPVIVDCPDRAYGKDAIAAVAFDGIQLRAKARVTLRTRIDRLIGGATKETIIARVQEGIVTTIGSSKRYKDVLENPDRISKTVLAKGLDSGTAFEILSIDIADVDVVGVGEEGNVDAKLEAERAEADMRIARAKAEERRAMAAAREQEMIALVQENRAKVVEREALIPEAIAESFRSGNLGLMDYYRLRNVQADTTMRESISGGGPGASPKSGPEKKG
ncbi:MAG: hypothetical protein BIFFINMI_03387 [Phycisphaerae bacterium]|nr:hypothetical protein [Phycisphaerae bacterium]